ncbi:MAG: prolipoprotein diacylglyceryl transferase [Clostridia bacterium]|nr:prolipoprotein diacylglyceryl transferase [Clostridia bacterium]
MTQYINFFGRVIPVYGLLFFIGIFVAAAVAALICKKKSIDRYDVVCSAIYSMIGAGIGSKLLFILVSLRQIIELELTFEEIIRGGFVFYGGLIGGALGLLIYTKQFKLKTLPLFDLYAVVLPLGHAFGRVGCFFAGCCYGMEYHGPFSHTYTSSIGNTPVGVPLFPVQLLESGLLVVLFIIGLIIYLKLNLPVGMQTALYACEYAVVRFTLEFLRGDSERGSFLYLSTSQWTSILVIAFVIISVIIFKRKHHKVSR